MLSTTVAAENASQAKGELQNGRRRWLITDDDQLKKAKDYRPLIITYRNGSPVQLKDVAQIDDSYSDLYNHGSFNGKPSVLVRWETPRLGRGGGRSLTDTGVHRGDSQA